MGALSTDHIYVFKSDEYGIRYLPAGDVIARYLEHSRRKPDDSLIAVLTRLRLNYLAKHPTYSKTLNRSSSYELQDTMNNIRVVLNTASQPFRDDPQGHLTYKGNHLYFFALPMSREMQKDIGEFYVVTKTFHIQDFEITDIAYNYFDSPEEIINFSY